MRAQLPWHQSQRSETDSVRRPGSADGGQERHRAEGGRDLGSDWAFRPLSLWHPDKNPGTHHPLSVLQRPTLWAHAFPFWVPPYIMPLGGRTAPPALEHTIHSVSVGGELGSSIRASRAWPCSRVTGRSLSEQVAGPHPSDSSRNIGAGVWALELGDVVLTRTKV